MHNGRLREIGRISASHKKLFKLWYEWADGLFSYHGVRRSSEQVRNKLTILIYICLYSFLFCEKCERKYEETRHKINAQFAIFFGSLIISQHNLKMEYKVHYLIVYENNTVYLLSWHCMIHKNVKHVLKECKGGRSLTLFITTVLLVYYTVIFISVLACCFSTMNMNQFHVFWI